MTTLTKTTKRICHGGGDTVTLSTGEWMRGWVRCSHCSKTFNVGQSAKTKTIPKHNAI